jgi:hypothetical protein
MLCECCGENEVATIAVDHGFGLCDACARIDICDCGSFLDEPVYQWEDAECERCLKSRENHEWLEATAAEVERVAEAHGWTVGRWTFAQTNSRYAELTREIDDDECETIKVRVSDHGSCYCSEDYSLAKNPSGHDHTIEALESRLV